VGVTKNEVLRDKWRGGEGKLEKIMQWGASSVIRVGRWKGASGKYGQEKGARGKYGQENGARGKYGQKKKLLESFDGVT
jgi:hypothetical protein